MRIFVRARAWIYVGKGSGREDGWHGNLYGVSGHAGGGTAVTARDDFNNHSRASGLISQNRTHRLK